VSVSGARVPKVSSNVFTTIVQRGSGELGMARIAEFRWCSARAGHGRPYEGIVGVLILPLSPVNAQIIPTKPIPTIAVWSERHRTGRASPFADLGELSGRGALRVCGESVCGLSGANQGSVREELLIGVSPATENCTTAWAVKPSPRFKVKLLPSSLVLSPLRVASLSSKF
jgi:hypothetical protein